MHAPHMTPTGSTPAATAPAPARPPASPPRTAPARPGVKPDEGGGLRVLTYLRLHWLMIAFCGTLLGAGGAFAAWELLASKYESYALLHVSSAPSVVANGGNREQARTDFVTYVKTTSALIKSEFVLNAALRDIKDLPTIRAQKDPIKFLEEELIVVWQDGSEVVRIVCKTAEAADAKRIVDAVQAAFMKEVVEKEVKQQREFLGKVEEAKDKILEIIGRKTEKPEKPAAKGPNPTPPAPGTPAGGAPEIPNPVPPAPGPLPAITPGGPVAPAGGPLAAAPGVVPTIGWESVFRVNPQILVSRVASLMSQAESLPLAINDGKRQLALLERDLEAAKNAPVSQLTRDAVDKDGEVQIQTVKAAKARQAYEFRYNSATNKNAPGVVELKEAWEYQEARLKEMRKDKEEMIERVRRIAEGNKIADQMNALLATLNRQQAQLKFVQAELGKAEKLLAELPAPGEKGVMRIDGRVAPEYSAAAGELETTDGIFRRLVQQYYTTQMALNSPARVRILQQGSNPVQKEMKKQIMGTVFAGVMGFGVMILGVIGFETLTRRVSSLADVRSASPAPVVAVIPGSPAEATGKDPAKRAAANEAIDKLRAHVSQAWLARGATTVAVTSPLGDEGKAFTAFGLASSLAQSGYRTLLVDFDLRDPRVHEFAGVENAAGVCELLRGEVDPRSAVQFLPSGLHLLPAGKWSDEARKAATGERLESLLAKLKGPYDCVVLHGHALLTAAESVEVARRCEVVLVCALYRETTSPLLKKAADRVATMEIPYTGVVYVGATGSEALC